MAELTQSISVWTRQAEQAIRQVGRAADAGGGGGSTTPTVYGNLTETGSSILAILGGSGAVVGSGVTIQVTQADATHSGYLTDTDWNTFNGKQAAGSYLTDAPSDGSFYARKNAAWAAVTSPSTGNLTETGSSILTITGGAGAVVGSGVTIAVTQADATHNGFLSSTDWGTFSGKLSDAPSDGTTYGRLNGAWAGVSGDILGTQVFS